MAVFQRCKSLQQDGRLRGQIAQANKHHPVAQALVVCTSKPHAASLGAPASLTLHARLQLSARVSC